MEVFGALANFAENPISRPKTPKSSGKTNNRILSHKQQIIIKYVRLKNKCSKNCVITVVGLLILFFMSRFVYFCIIKH